jgi:hypothetical protein
MPVVLILHVELDPGVHAPTDVEEYARTLVMSVEQHRTHNPSEVITLEARADQVRHIGVEVIE